MITITVKLFAAYQEVYGQSEVSLEVPSGTTVAMIGDRIRSQHAALQPLASVTRYGVNLNFVSPETIVEQGDEIVLIPPVSGG